MTRIEELVVVPATPAQAMRALLTVKRAQDWMAPDVRLVPHTSSPVLGAGDHFALELFGGLRFEYVIEATSDREVAFTYDGPWRGEERWSFVADGAETLVRRSYEVHGGSPLAALAWGTVGRAVVAMHMRFELSRLKSAIQRDPGPRGEIEATSGPLRSAPDDSAQKEDGAARPSFPVDDG
ncbi:MAG TPA: SRPBCC family protein [Gemmatimonadaceae bacterium]|nr:SRPBCC family protein [Gemmatimonadaceae bacterium]